MKVITPISYYFNNPSKPGICANCGQSLIHHKDQKECPLVHSCDCKIEGARITNPDIVQILVTPEELLALRDALNNQRLTPQPNNKHFETVMAGVEQAYWNCK